MRWLVLVGILVSVPAVACPRQYFVAVDSHGDLKDAPVRLPANPTLWLANGVRLFDADGGSVPTREIDARGRYRRVIVLLDDGQFLARGSVWNPVDGGWYLKEESYSIGAPTIASPITPREGDRGPLGSLALLLLLAGLARRQLPG